MTSKIYAKQAEEYFFCRSEGRLGNQLFSVAAAMSLAIDHNATVIYPDLLNKKGCDTQVNRRKIFWRLELLEKPLQYTWLQGKDHLPFPLRYKKGMLLMAKPWSEDFFIAHKEKILPMFDPSSEILEDLHSKFSDVINHPESVAIHIRTLDGEPRPQNVRPLYGQKFVKKAMEHFSENAFFIVCSDDIEWCKENLSGLRQNMLFVENEPYYNDFYLMSLCKHHIVSNSTFSWWSAYLSKNPTKVVVAPKYFYYPGHPKNSKLSNLWPKEWITIDKNWEKRSNPYVRS